MGPGVAGGKASGGGRKIDKAGELAKLPTKKIGIV